MGRRRLTGRGRVKSRWLLVVKRMLRNIAVILMNVLVTRTRTFRPSRPASVFIWRLELIHRLRRQRNPVLKTLILGRFVQWLSKMIFLLLLLPLTVIGLWVIRRPGLTGRTLLRAFTRRGDWQNGVMFVTLIGTVRRLLI